MLVLFVCFFFFFFNLNSLLLQTSGLLLFQGTSYQNMACGITMETTLRISFLLTYRLTVKLFTLFVESGLGQHAIGFLKSCLGILSRLVLSGPSACFHSERSIIQTNKQYTGTFIAMAFYVLFSCSLSLVTKQNN